MITINVSDNIKDVTRGLDDLARRQVPFATAKALTNTAKAALAELQREIKSVFDRPTPFITKSPFMTPATKSKLEATVGVRDIGGRMTPAQYLAEHFAAGSRGNKPMERAMRAAGILRAGWLVVPSSDGIKKDAYGNVSKATVSRVIRELQGGARRQDKGATYRLFVVHPGQADRRTRHFAPGIWSIARIGDQSVIKPVFFFVTAATYRKVLDLPRIAQRVVANDFGRNFRTALDDALRTAR